VVCAGYRVAHSGLPPSERSSGAYVSAQLRGAPRRCKHLRLTRQRPIASSTRPDRGPTTQFAWCARKRRPPWLWTSIGEEPSVTHGISGYSGGHSTRVTPEMTTSE
jgi:hypothetical protein